MKGNQVFEGEIVSLTLNGGDESCMRGDLSKASEENKPYITMYVTFTCTGNFTLTASAENLNETTSEQFEVRVNSLRLTLEVAGSGSLNEADVHQLIAVTIGLYDVTEAMWQIVEYVDLISPDDAIECPGTEMTNIRYTNHPITLNCKFRVSGKQKLTVKTGEVSKSIIVTVRNFSFKFSSEINVRLI